MRDPEILERLDPQDLLGLCKRLQSYMALCSEHAASNQNQITNRIREVRIFFLFENELVLIFVFLHRWILSYVV